MTSSDLCPLKAGELYFNFGCYWQVRRPEGKEPYHNTKIMDDKCFELDGIRITTRREGRTPTLYEKVAMVR